MNKKIETGERILPDNIKSQYEYLLYLRHLFAYKFVCKMLLKNDTILDIGCGEGYGTNLLSNYAMKIIGIDSDVNAITHAKEKYSGNNLSFIHYSGDNLPFEEFTFDKIISFQVIEHIFSDHKFVAEVYRILKQGGEFFLTTPNKRYRLKPQQKPWYQFHVREYNKDEIETLFKTRFNKVEIKFIKAPEEFYKMEVNVAKIASFVQKYDFLELNRFIPYKVRKIIFKMFDIFSYSQKKNLNCKKTWSTEDFSISNEDYLGLDLFAISKK